MYLTIQSVNPLRGGRRVSPVQAVKATAPGLDPGVRSQR